MVRPILDRVRRRGVSHGRPNRMRSFDPRLVGELECRTWVTYYLRDWPAFLWAAVGLTRHAFALPWPATLRGAWLVLRANQAWAPHPVNDPARARRCMLGFYRLVAARHGESFDVQRAAELEVDWWRIHRELQHGGDAEASEPLVAALAALYSHVYRVPAEAVRPAALERAAAMRDSDAWVAAGRDAGSPLIAAERAALVRSYAALLAAVHHV
jgi:hypothetical protein